MSRKPTGDIAAQKLDPHRHFDGPVDVLREPTISYDDKRAILSAMEHDAQELDVAAGENLPGVKRRTLRDVREALQRLDRDARTAGER